MARFGRCAGGITVLVVLLGVLFAGDRECRSARRSRRSPPCRQRSGERLAVACGARHGGQKDRGRFAAPRARDYSAAEAPGSDTALFGFSVSLSSNGAVALIGAPNTDAPKGAAYVFARIGGVWIPQQKLQVIQPVPFSARFGSSVSLSSDGSTALIGAQGTNPASGGQDRAYVFARNLAGLFMLQQELPNPTALLRQWVRLLRCR